MDEHVMTPAEQGQVVEARRAAVLPEDDVVDIAVVRRPQAAIGNTMTIAGRDVPPDRRLNRAGGAPDVKNLTRSVGDDARDLRVTGQESGLLSCHRANPLQVR